ncbi:AgmX/PglI C-terminal domain-containing protein [bacterium]|nr:AgmX/PglI C-terminal domain-containing protein [bacterium]
MKKVLVIVTVIVIIALFAAYKCSRSRGAEDVEISPETSQPAPVETSPETSQTEQNEEPSEEVKEEPAATPAKEPKKEGRKAKPAVEKPAAEKPAPTAAPAEKKPVAREEKAVLDRPMPEVKRAPNEANIDSAGVTKVINVSRAAIKRCYDKALISNPQLNGKMSIKIVINKEGRVDRTEIVDDSLHDAEVAKCVKGVIGRLRFPKPADGTATVTFPFAFDPKNH